MSWTIYGSPISLFTRKLEAAFEAYGVRARSVRRSEENRAWLEARAGTHQVPVLATPHGWMLADTTPIMMWLDALYPARRLFPDGAIGVLVHVLEEVLDEWVSRVMVHYRWHYPENTQFVISQLNGREIGLEAAMKHPLAQWGPRACRATGTENESQQRAAEREYLALLDALESQLARTRYALGGRPSAVDAALIGGLRGHTLNDPVPDLSAYPRVRAWAMAPLHASGDGELAAFPDSTPFAQHLLTLARDQYRPFIIANQAARESGAKTFTAISWDEEVTYLTRKYPEASRQMVSEHLNERLPANERRLVAQWLQRWQLDACFSA